VIVEIRIQRRIAVWTNAIAPSASRVSRSTSRLLAFTLAGQRRPKWYHFSYHLGVGMAITASEARKNLFPLIEQVNADRTPVEITSKRGDAVLMSRDDYDALEETAHLLRAPANARRLLESLEQAMSGARAEHDLTR
jgi:antitoxin YefM